MKNIFKLLFLSVLVFAVGCENTDNSRFQSNPEFGWIEFQTAATTQAINASSESIDVTIDFTAPINKSSVEINWSINNVLGNASDAVTRTSGTIVIPANANQAVLTLPVKAGADLALAAGDISFDVVITAVSRGIGIGLAA